jgi:hypothetical protein
VLILLPLLESILVKVNAKEAVNDSNKKRGFFFCFLFFVFLLFCFVFFCFVFVVYRVALNTSAVNILDDLSRGLLIVRF